MTQTAQETEARATKRTEFIATGKRKNSIARVRLAQGGFKPGIVFLRLALHGSFPQLRVHNDKNTSPMFE